MYCCSQFINVLFSSFQALAWCCFAILPFTWNTANGHGRLIEPPSRASAWRYGFDTPHNYNDHELYCGGFSRQWHKNKGKCGVCGDAWDSPAPRAHELGGRFGKGVIVRRYSPKDTITLKVELTANHNGYFEFRLCDEPSETTQDCLNKNVLKLAGRNGTKFYPKDGNKIYEMKYHLPEDLECAHCVLQWRYLAGNNWGDCENGTQAVGCGRQEEFRACADIAIGKGFATTTRRPRPPYVPPGRKPTLPTPEESTGSSWYSVVVVVVALLLTVVFLAGMYLYHYRGGTGIKSLLKSKAAPPAPVPPPRQKKASLSRETPPELSPNKIIPESGFETVDLRAK